MEELQVVLCVIRVNVHVVPDGIEPKMTRWVVAGALTGDQLAVVRLPGDPLPRLVKVRRRVHACTRDGDVEAWNVQEDVEQEADGDEEVPRKNFAVRV